MQEGVSPKRDYSVRVDYSAGVIPLVLLNGSDIGIHRRIDTRVAKRSGFARIHVNDLLHDGLNRLELRLQDPLPPGSEAASLSVVLLAYDDFFKVDEEGRHGEYKWTYRPDDPAPRFVAELTLEQAPPTRVWQQAELVPTLTDTERAKIIALLRRYHEVLQSKDMASYRKINEYAREELRLAYRYNDEAFEIYDSVEEAVRTYPNWHIDMPPESEIEFLQVAEGRAYMATHKREALFVVQGLDEEHHEYTPTVAKIDGEWIIVR